jgi:5'-nucleotidase
MRRIERRHLLPGAAAFAAALLVALLGLNAGASQPRSKAARSGTVQIQLLGVNDFHGHLEPPEPDLGGAAWLGAWLHRAAASREDRTIRVHAGDMVGASPLISSHWHDLPTIEATNLMHFDVGTLGNHEFDEGGAEMMRLVHHARYPYLAANTVSRETGEPILPPYRVLERAGVKIGFIGVTTTDTPFFLLSQWARQYRWLDISDTVNRYVPELQRQGVQAIVVLAHAGAFQDGDSAAGQIVDEARQMDPAVDVIVAGHTHSRLDTEVDGKLIVQSLSYGVAFERVQMTIDRKTDDVVSKSAEVLPTRHSIKPDPDLLGLVDSYKRRVAPLANRVIGYAPHQRDNPEVDRIAVEAQREFAGADVAFEDSGNTRSDIDAGPISYADAFEVQAYEHPVWRLHMQGSDVLEAMREQPNLLVSGTPAEQIRPDAVYTVAANGILLKRAPFNRPVEREKVGTDLEALAAYLSRSSAQRARGTAAPRARRL